MNKDYSDMLDMPHHVSIRHPRMSMDARAGQFAPFAALSGYGDEIDETIRRTDNKADIITDNIYKYASRKEYYECAYNAFDQIETILDGGKIAEPMRHISNAVVSIVLAFFVNFFIVLGASKIKKANAAEIIKNCDVEFEASNVSGSKTGTHKVYSPVSESSGGSSGGGGGGGGGGFSGGGGGHSF